MGVSAGLVLERLTLVYSPFQATQISPWSEMALVGRREVLHYRRLLEAAGAGKSHHTNTCKRLQIGHYDLYSGL